MVSPAPPPTLPLPDSQQGLDGERRSLFQAFGLGFRTSALVGVGVQEADSHPATVVEGASARALFDLL